MNSKKKLLINSLYYRPVGHVVEALKYARGYYEANKNIDIYLLLNANSPIELANSYHWIKKTYPVSLLEVCKKGEKATCLRKIPKTWDYIISDSRVRDFKKGWDEDDLIYTQQILQKIFKANIARGYTIIVHTGLNPNKEYKKQIIPYSLNPQLSLSIPREFLQHVKKYKYYGSKICIMLGGSAGANQSPTVEIWQEICQSLFDNIPNLKIYFTGITKNVKGRTTTNDFTLKSIDSLVRKLSNAENCFNIGLWNQLALIRSCDLFLSPHTGFAFLAPIIGTPWLTISGCRWHEYLFNHIPFYSILPECGYYPSQNETKKGCGKLLSEDKKSICMQDSLLRNKIPEIIKGAKLLLSKEFTYRKAINLHLNKIKKPPYDPKRFFFFDGIKGLLRTKKIIIGTNP